MFSTPRPTRLIMAAFKGLGGGGGGERARHLGDLLSSLSSPRLLES